MKFSIEVVMKKIILVVTEINELEFRETVKTSEPFQISVLSEFSCKH